MNKLTRVLPGALAALAIGFVSQAAAESVERVAFTYCTTDPVGTYRCAVVLMDGDGTNPLAVAEGIRPSWSPDRSQLAFESGRIHLVFDDSYLTTAIQTVNLANGTVVDLGEPACQVSIQCRAIPPTPDLFPAWSPGRSEIAFLSEGDLYVLDVGDVSGTQRRLTDIASITSFAWSPDGSKIAFGRPDGLYVIRMDGPDTTHLVGLGAADSPTWSPDGRTIVFTCTVEGLQNICRVDADGAGFTTLTGGPQQNDFDPVWSPDGKTIVFATTRYSDPVGTSSDIAVMNADGTGITRLTVNQSAFAPTWSPSGTRIAFEARCDTADRGIWIMNADGTDPRCVVANGGQAVWMPGTQTRVNAPPVITHSPITTATTNTAVVVTAAITSDIGVVQASLSYRDRFCGTVSDDCYVGVPLTASGDVYRGTIPATMLRASRNDVEYYIEARDATGNVSRTPMGAPFIPYLIEVSGPPVVTVEIDGNGVGTVSSTPAGIACPPTCAATFPSGTMVTLAATPALGTLFRGWQLACSSDTAPCIFQVGDAPTFVMATFMRGAVLNVRKAGSGQGTVRSADFRIDCGPACQATYFLGTYVALNAEPNPGSLFLGWNGGGCDGDWDPSSCLVNLDWDADVTATFVADVAPLAARCAFTTGEVGVAYSASCTIGGGVPPYTCSVASGTAPAGLTLASNCTLTGTPTMPGGTTFGVRVADAVGAALNTRTSLSIVPALTITTTSVPPIMVNHPYSRTLSVSGGRRPYSWSVIDGTLPAGVTLTGLGQITGLATTTGVTSVTAQVEDSLGGRAVRTFHLVTNLGPLRARCTPGPAEVGVTYRGACTPTGGLPPYTCALVSGTLPASLTLNDDCSITGSPTAAGTRAFVIRAADSGGLSSAVGGRVTVLPQLTVAIGNLARQAANRSFVTRLRASGGRPPYGPWEIVDGTLPSGVTLNPALGQLIGTPTTVGISDFTVRVMDALGGTAGKSLELIVNLGPLTAHCNAGPAEATVAYRDGCTVRGGLPPYSCALVSGNVSAGLTLAGDCSITGTPTIAGSSPFRARATDSGGLSQVLGGNVIVTPAIRITTPGLPIGHTMMIYSARLVASGGRTPLTWSIIEGTLAPGLGLNRTTGAITGMPTAPGSTRPTFRVIDALGGVAEATLTLTIN